MIFTGPEGWVCAFAAVAAAIDAAAKLASPIVDHSRRVLMVSFRPPANGSKGSKGSMHGGQDPIRRPIVTRLRGASSKNDRPPANGSKGSKHRRQDPIRRPIVTRLRGASSKNDQPPANGS